MHKYGRWKNAVEGKGLRVNVDKTKGIQLLFRKKRSVSKVDPCGVCGERVGCNFIQCMKCQRWVHHCNSDEAVSARIGSVRKKFRELSGVLVGRQGLSLKQWGKIYQCCVRPVLLYCCEAWELTVADEVRLCGVEHRMIRIMCEVRLVDRVLTDILRDRVSVVV